MARGRHTPEQIIRKLREADRLLAEGRMSPRSLGTWRYIWAVRNLDKLRPWTAG
jgi:hypothetical protein